MMFTLFLFSFVDCAFLALLGGLYLSQGKKLPPVFSYKCFIVFMLFGCVTYFLLFLHIVHVVTAPFVERPTLFSMDCLSLFLSMLCFCFYSVQTFCFSFFFDLRLSVNVLFSFQIF